MRRVNMDWQERFELIKREPTEEIVTEEELIELLKTKDRIVAYDGLNQAV